MLGPQEWGNATIISLICVNVANISSLWICPAHVLSSCPVALSQDHYTYQHDQV